MICERYDTIVVPFPFADIPILKRRPAAVISAGGFNRANDATVVAMITTAKASNWPSDVAITDLDAAGLRVPCLIRWRMATIPNDLVLRRLGELNPLDRLECERQLANILR
ncbi:mRNA interferase MazF [Rhizobium rosettiformans]|uniref:mRNA interferase MazF n=1 Tax=Rhizobium rosettiformans TaxID=1368430 RepID=A0A7W8MDF4_9HYPH|nr:type II toxin-antitoxin system PemK/MazF family toxin [Rhizobium rosettiformans]MBB5276777.1 mRNA interferase MazF [Rhizobium rosettiformans]